MNLERLSDHFAPDEVEWRVQSCTEVQGRPKALVLCYITNRAIQDRLDEVCGKTGWKNEYKQAPEGGIMCGISIRDEHGEWITKWDGASNTDIEAVKGGLSNAMKRAAVQWGIGRYLYKLDTSFVDIVDKKPSPAAHYIKDDRKKIKGYWMAPKLPGWALPKSSKTETRQQKQRQEASQEPPTTRQEEPAQRQEQAKPSPMWDAISKGKQQHYAIKRNELIAAINWGEKYPNGYEDWIKSANLLGCDDSGKPSFSASSEAQIEHLIRTMETIALRNPARNVVAS